MLRAAASVCAEGPRELLAAQRRDVFKLFRAAAHGAGGADDPRAPPAPLAATQTVLTAAHGPASPPPPRPAPPPRAAPPPPPPPPRRAWTGAAAALALTASIGGVYFYRRINESDKEPVETERRAPASASAPAPAPAPDPWAGGPVYPASGAELPARVEFLVVGGGTAAFAALRALRAARPSAALLLVGAERAPPYMRPPLSKELWRDPALAAAAQDPAGLAFTQWNGKRRRLVYEPLSFYTPVEKLRAGGGGAGLARGWRVVRLDLAARTAELEAPGGAAASVGYGQVLLATGAAPRRLAALAPAAAAGRALPLHAVADAGRLAARLDDPAARRVAVVGGGLLATELAAALADRLRGSGKSVVQVYRERDPLQDLLPPYLAADAARRLRAAGVELLPDSDVASSAVLDGRVLMRLRRAGAAQGEGEGGEEGGGGGAELAADVVVECVGCEPNDALAADAGLELDAERGGVLVNAELQARSGVWAAGDVASFYDAALGRRRVAHHDHAVLSGRRAAANMAAAAAAAAADDPAERVEPYTHQSMFWSDLGPDLGLEAIGIIDSALPTVGVFSTDAVSDAGAALRAGAGAGEGAGEGAGAGTGAGAGALVADADNPAGGDGAAAARRYERGVVFYLRGRRVVGVLLWNLFNRMHVARQVLAQGEFDDLLEVAKLFAPHEPE